MFSPMGGAERPRGGRQGDWGRGEGLGVRGYWLLVTGETEGEAGSGYGAEGGIVLFLVLVLFHLPLLVLFVFLLKLNPITDFLLYLY